jgi:transposase InsO family protein
VVNHKRVSRLIAANGLGARRKKQFLIITKSKKGQWIAENILNRQFSVSSPNRAWVSDITYIATAEGWLYLAVVLDLYSRRVFGWSMDRRIDSQFVLQALSMAAIGREPPQGLIFHSDRGFQYASQNVRNAISSYGMRQSMSRKGNCWDNACAEAFFNSLKSELIGKHIFQSRSEAQSAIFEYIEIFYNGVRLHSTLDYLSPNEYEKQLNRMAS